VFSESGQFCVHKVNADDSKGELVACHNTEAEAEAQVRALYANEGMTSRATFLVDNFVKVAPGQPFRLFPWGVVVKNGVSHDVQPGQGWRLPHFKPPIKLGSHDMTTPAGGHIRGLQEGFDGLYAIPEYTPKGLRAIDEGDYRYQSPEVIWQGGVENPEDGSIIPGPMIIGVALLHTPHLGEKAALYHVTEVSEMAETQTNGTDIPVVVPKNLLDALTTFLHREPKQEPGHQASKDFSVDVTNLQAELEQYKSELEALKADKLRQARIEKYRADLIEAKLPGEDAEILASMTEDQAKWVIEKFSALATQIKDSALFGETGSSAQGVDNPAQALNAWIEQYMREKGVDYNKALAASRKEAPELFASYAVSIKTNKNPTSAS
jgi:hypothetical protein